MLEDAVMAHQNRIFQEAQFSLDAHFWLECYQQTNPAEPHQERIDQTNAIFKAAKEASKP